MTSQLVIFRAFFSPPPTTPILNLQKNPVNQLIKTFWPKINSFLYKIDWKYVGFATLTVRL